MDIRIDGPHKKALIGLMQRNGEKTGIGMLRLLIRDEARKVGIWPADTEIESQPQEESDAEKVVA